MVQNKSQPIALVYVIASLFSLFGVIVSTGGALYIYFSLAHIPDAPLWPLPGFALLDWFLWGLLDFLLIGLTTRVKSAELILFAFFSTGAFCPLIILGIASIGLLTLPTFLFFFIAISLLAFRIKPRLLRSLGQFAFGAIFNFALLELIIILFRNLPHA
jgi:hypothetical protein